MAFLVLDIQSTTIYAICFKKIKEALQVLWCEAIHLSEPISAQDKIEHWPLLQTILSGLVKRRRLLNFPVITGVSVSQVLIESIQLPLGLTESDILKEIRQYLKEELADDSQQPLALDYRLQPNPLVADQVVHFAAMRQAYLQALQNAVEKAGLVLQIVDIDVFAVARLFKAQLATAATVGIFFATRHHYYLIRVTNKQIEQYSVWLINHNNPQSELQVQLAQPHFTQISIWYGAGCEDALLHFPFNKIQWLKPSALHTIFSSITTLDTQSMSASYLLGCGLALHEMSPC